MKHLSKIAYVLICFCPMIACLASVHTNYAHAAFVIGTPVNFGPILNTEVTEADSFLTKDGLTIYFSRHTPGIFSGDIMTSSRMSLQSAWSPPEIFTPASNPAPIKELGHPYISDDGLAFFYDSKEPGVINEIFGLSRDTIEDPWGPRFALPAPINDGVSSSSHARMSPDGLTLMFASDRSGGEGDTDIWEAVRPTLTDPWTAHVLGPNVNTSFRERNPVMSSDGLTLLFSSLQVGGEGSWDLWMSTRNVIGDEWGPASNLGPTVNTALRDEPSQLWEPGNLLLFKSWGLPGFGIGDLFYVSVVPEPSTVAMSFSGVLLLMGYVGRRRKRA